VARAGERYRRFDLTLDLLAALDWQVKTGSLRRFTPMGDDIIGPHGDVFYLPECTDAVRYGWIDPSERYFWVDECYVESVEDSIDRYLKAIYWPETNYGAWCGYGWTTLN
jgi:hypothetical protein